MTASTTAAPVRSTAVRAPWTTTMGSRTTADPARSTTTVGSRTTVGPVARAAARVATATTTTTDRRHADRRDQYERPGGRDAARSFRVGAAGEFDEDGRPATHPADRGRGVDHDPPGRGARAGGVRGDRRLDRGRRDRAGARELARPR